MGVALGVAENVLALNGTPEAPQGVIDRLALFHADVSHRSGFLYKNDGYAGGRTNPCGQQPERLRYRAWLHASNGFCHLGIIALRTRLIGAYFFARFAFCKRLLRSTHGDGMDVLVVGGGGREHALVWALHRSPSVDKIYCAPGNAGIAQIAECWEITPGDLHGLARAADKHAVDLVVVGPEAPLTSGISAVLDQVGIACFGPTAAAAILEGSKAFAKSFMERHNIPTPAFRIFHDLTPAVEFARDPEWGFPSVVKADGLAAGKGVIMCAGPDEAEQAVRLCMEDGAFGAAGSTVIIEQCLVGAEATVMALTDGEQLVVLPPSQDHKQAYDGDQGPNTGGMGAFAPANDVVGAAMLEQITERILRPAIDGMAAEDRRFQGVIYAGLMLTESGPSVLEFNCRFGDPEAEVVLPLIESDVGELLAAIADGSVPDSVAISDRHAAIVVLAAEGYPGTYRHGDAIEGLAAADEIEDVVVFHAGTSSDDDQIVTSGGRVLGVTGIGDNREAALAAAYGTIDKINFPGMHYRQDIGRRDQEKE